MKIIYFILPHLYTILLIGKIKIYVRFNIKVVVEANFESFIQLVDILFANVSHQNKFSITNFRRVR